MPNSGAERLNRDKLNDVGLPEGKDPRLLHFGITWRLVVSIMLLLLYLWIGFGNLLAPEFGI
jgi:hypothetical protein